jgi:hypothetical protein
MIAGMGAPAAEKTCRQRRPASKVAEKEIGSQMVALQFPPGRLRFSVGSSVAQFSYNL